MYHLVILEKGSVVLEQVDFTAEKMTKEEDKLRYKELVNKLVDENGWLKKK